MVRRLVPAPDPSVVELAASTLLNGPRLSAAVASVDLPDAPGLYAVFAEREARAELGLPEVAGGQPIYVGKAEGSLLDRDGKTHFALGRTGQSTLRRSIAALLRPSLGLRGRPRNLDTPGYFDKFDLAPGHDATLQRWIGERPAIATWLKPPDETDHDGTYLLAIERALLRRWTPPLNDKDNPGKWREVRAIRKVMADDARCRTRLAGMSEERVGRA